MVLKIAATEVLATIQREGLEDRIPIHAELWGDTTANELMWLVRVGGEDAQFGRFAADAIRDMCEAISQAWSIGDFDFHWEEAGEALTDVVFA